MVIICTDDAVRGWLTDATRALGYVSVVTASESGALRAVQMLQVDLAIVDCYGLAEGSCAALVASLMSMSAELSLPIVCIVSSRWRFTHNKESVNPHCEVIHLPWPMTLKSLRRAIAESLRHRPDNHPRPMSRPSA